MPRASLIADPHQASPVADASGDVFSKTRRKEAMRELQDLGRALLGLDPIRLAALGLPERLADAIALARKLSKHEARRRQMQYIGRLMRDVDPEPLRAALATGTSGTAAERAHFANLERWRHRILDDPQGLDAFSIAYPTAPRAALATLVADVRAERMRAAPPRKSRALFREIKRIIDQSAIAE